MFKLFYCVETPLSLFIGSREREREHFVKDHRHFYESTFKRKHIPLVTHSLYNAIDLLAFHTFWLSSFVAYYCVLSVDQMCVWVLSFLCLERHILIISPYSMCKCVKADLNVEWVMSSCRIWTAENTYLMLSLRTLKDTFLSYVLEFRTITRAIFLNFHEFSCCEQRFNIQLTAMMCSFHLFYIQHD